MSLTRRTSILLANKNLSLTKYIESVKKKYEEDEDYAKWDITKPLPKLPVPELSLSLEKYLRCIMPILSEENYKKTENIVREFGKSGGIGEKLQEILLKIAEKKDNWAYDWWLNDMYMLNKLPLPINSNPGMVFPQENFPDEDAQLRFVSRLISGIMDYKLVIDAHALPVDRCTCREKGQPLCMEQYYRLFSSYRVPGVDKDKLVDSTTNLAQEPEHIIVISNNQIFVLDVVVNFTRLSEDQLYHQLKRIKRQSEEDEGTSSAFANIGFLTSLPRDQWALARSELMRESTNRDCLDMIERCIFVICLDKAVDPNTFSSSNEKSLKLNGTNSIIEKDLNKTPTSTSTDEDLNQIFIESMIDNHEKKNNWNDNMTKAENLKEDELTKRKHFNNIESLANFNNSNNNNSNNNNNNCWDNKENYELNYTNDHNNSMDVLDEINSCKLMVPLAFQMLHGCNSKNNSGNRWFDKTMQFIISEDGTCGLNYEHSPSEGIVVIELSEHLFRYMEEKKKQKLYRMPSICELPMPRKLRWKISERISKWIEEAKTAFDKQIEDLDFCLLKYSKFGRDFPKKVKMSPDSFIQLSMQLAYYKLYKRLVSTYESASTRRFKRGRVDNIRANSCETLAWVKSMCSTDIVYSKEEKFRLFQKAVQYQTDLMIQSIIGKGMDCHLLALKSIAQECGYETPQIFLDESYKISNHFSLSTSQIPTSMDSFMCYGPVVPDGYGCSYNPKPNYILFAISSFKSCSMTSTKRFAESLKASLNEMYELCSTFI